MSDFVRKALQELSGNHFKLWACVITYRDGHTLEMFAERTGLDLASVKRLLPGITGDTYLARDTSQRPHRYTLASQLSLRFQEDTSESRILPLSPQAIGAERNLRVANYDSQGHPGLAFDDSLYLEAVPKVAKCDFGARDISSSVSIESLKDTVSQGDYRSWSAEQIAAWRKQTLKLAEDSAQIVGDGGESLGLHIAVWSHARILDQKHGGNNVDRLFGILRSLELKRDQTGHPQGAAWTAKCKALFVSIGFPLGRRTRESEQTDDPEILAFRRAGGVPDQPAKPSPDPAAAATAERARAAAAKHGGGCPPGSGNKDNHDVKRRRA